MASRPPAAETLADPWPALQEEARRTAAAEPLLGALLHATLLSRGGFAEALAAVLAERLADPFLGADRLADLAAEAMAAEPGIADAARADLQAILHSKGFHALEAHRIAHWLWGAGRVALAGFLQARIARVLAIDIHPAARFGHGVFIDHGTGVVIGETAVVGNDVSILQGVTLGGTGKEAGDRHPKVRDGVLLGAGAKVLGNVVIGRGAKVGAGSVVLRDVPPCATVAGVPARIVGWCGEAVPALAMNHALPVGEDTP